MKKYFLTLIIVLMACNYDRKEQQNKPMTESQKKIITEFAKKLTASINSYEYDLVRNSWDNAIFRKKVNNLTKTEQNVFDYYFDSEFSSLIMNVMIDLIDKLKYSNGKIILSGIDFFAQHAEITYTLVYGKKIDFWRYRIELQNNIPKLTDYYSFKEEIWQSQNIKNILHFDSNSADATKELVLANKNIQIAEWTLKRGDTLEALHFLNQVPDTFLTKKIMSLKIINVAHLFNDSIFHAVLKKAEEINQSLYIKYLYDFYFHKTVELKEVFHEMENEIGPDNQFIDSLKTLKYLWY